jgi:hypothetical protein
MTRFVRLGILLFAVAGLAACSAKASAPKSAILNDFERVPDPGLLKRQFDPAEALKKPTYPSHDFDVSTSGYASVSSLGKESIRNAANADAKDKAAFKAVYKFIQGKSAAQVRFTVPGDYKVWDPKDLTATPHSWETGFGMDTDSHTPLKVTDWSPYRYFDFRVYNPSALTQTVYVRFNDASSGVTLTSVAVPAGESEVELPLQQLSEARLNASNIKGFTLFLDTAKPTIQTADPVLYFDEIALYDTDSQARIKAALEEGESEDNDEDWDSEDEDTVRQIRVVDASGVKVEAKTLTATAGAK